MSCFLFLSQHQTYSEPSPAGLPGMGLWMQSLRLSWWSSLEQDFNEHKVMCLIHMHVCFLRGNPDSASVANVWSQPKEDWVRE